MSFAPAATIGATLSDPWSVTFATLPAGTFDITLKCTLGATAGGTKFKNKFSLTQSTNPISNEVVAQIPIPQSPNMSIAKYQRVRS